MEGRVSRRLTRPAKRGRGEQNTQAVAECWMCNLNPATKRRTMLFDTLRGEKLGTLLLSSLPPLRRLHFTRRGTNFFLKVGFVAPRSEYRKFISTVVGEQGTAEKMGRVRRPQARLKVRSRKVSKASEREGGRKAEREITRYFWRGRDRGREGGRKSNGMAREGGKEDPEAREALLSRPHAGGNY